MISQRFTLCVVPALSLLLFAQSADAQQITPTTRQSLPSRYYYAVLGAVGVPGVYEYSSGLPTLGDVIHAADGLTSEASGTFRIVREEQVSGQMFYSPDSKMLLLSGDILILEKSLSGRQRRDRSSADFGTQSLVQIVAVNLIHRPVVLSVPPEQATLEQIVTLLNQSLNIIPTVKILQAKTSEYVGPGKNLGKFRLISESILIFDPSVVRIDQIPKLPAVYKPKVTTASYRQIRSSSSEETLGENSRNVIQLATDSRSPRSQSESSQINRAAKKFWAPSSLENSPNPKAKSAYDIPEFWIPVKEDDLSTKPGADGREITPESPPALPPADPLAFLPDEKGVSESAENSTVPVETSESTSPLKTMASQGLIAVGLVGLLGAGWFVRRRLQQRVKPQFNFQPVKKKTGGILDALIENKLSLVEESFAFPEGLELQVPAASTVRTVPTLRTAPPVSQRKFRVDSSQTIQRPHLPSEVEEPEPGSFRSVTKTTQIDAIPEIPAVVSGLSEPVAMIQQTSDVPQSEELLQRIEQNSETEQTKFPEMAAFTAYVSPTIWPESASEYEPAVDSNSGSPSRTESASTSSEQTNRIDSAQTTSLRPHAHSTGWVLDRVLVALHGVTRQ